MKKANDVAIILDVHYNTVMNWIRSGKVAAVKMGRTWRISDEELERIMRNGVQNDSETA